MLNRASLKGISAHAVFAWAVAALAIAPAAQAAVRQPDKVVVVVLQDRASDAIGNPVWSYLNSIAGTGLVYTNSHGVTHPSTPNALALYSGSTQGIADNGRNHSFSTGNNLAKRLFDGGFSFSGYSESLPSNGSQATEAGGSVIVPQISPNPRSYNDLYTRNINPMAQFTNVGLLSNGDPRPNSDVNKTFDEFKNISNFANLPTVSFVIPNNLNNAHGSNEKEPWAGSSDEVNNDILRDRADDWLLANIDAYLQWAKQNNSLLIITQDEERYVGGTSSTITTLVHGDEDLFNPGTNDLNINHYDLLRTLTDMYGLAALGNSAGRPGLYVDGTGQLSAVPEPSTLALASLAGLALLRRRRS